MPKPKRTIKKFKAVGAYIFAGGFTVGVRDHFEVLCHLEGNNYGVSVFRKNFPGVPVHVGQKAWPTGDLAAEGVDFLYGNPPCAAWSGNNPNSHKSNGWETDPRVDCTRAFFGLLGAVKPKVWAWESVTQAPTKGKAFVDDLTRKAMALGYSVTQIYHDAQYLGVPQIRRRWFLVCHRVRLKFRPPDFDHPVSAADCLRGVKPTGGPAYDSDRFNKLFNQWLPKIKPGERLRRFWEREVCPPDRWEYKENGHVKGRVGLGHIRLKAEGPATATVGYSMVHPTEHRFLHLNEVQALAGFPQWFDFGGASPHAKELDLVARGVCPPVGEWLADSVRMSLEDNAPVKKPTATVVDFRCPGVDPVPYELTAPPANAVTRPTRRN